MTRDLHTKGCTPCEGDTLPFTLTQAREYIKEIEDWKLASNGKQISKTFTFKGFMPGVDVVNKIADLAEEEGHHPDLHLSYGELKIELTTHAIGGLSENDFILAAKIDRLEVK